MKMKTCIDIGKELGLTTLEECYDNIDRHCINFFLYERIYEELLELQKDIFYNNPDEFCRIFDSTKESLISKGWEIKESF